jgi:hypothetical protein
VTQIFLLPIAIRLVETLIAGQKEPREMRPTKITIIAILLLSSLAVADCIDDQEYESSVENFLDFWQYGHAILDASPQKITKTIDGITFTSDYDNGSLEDVSYVGTDEFSCTIYEEPGVLGTAKYWFRFRMTGVAGRTITLNIDHSANPRPVISADGVTWRRLTAVEAPTLYEIVLTFGATQDFAELAFFYPFGVDEIYQHVSAIVNSSADASTQTIGQSFQGRDMWMVTVTDRSVPDTDKHRVWVHSRVHAGEVTATPTVLGILEQVTENSPLGELLRTHCIFNIVPLMNVDGVFLGHTRWDSQGFDIERDWCTPVTLPEVLNIKAQVDNFMAGSNPIEVALNLHATQGNYTDTFFYKHVQPSVTANFELIQQHYIDAVDNATSLFDNLNPQTSQLHACQFIESYFWNNWGEEVMAMTHEGHFRRRITDSDWITDEDYRELGRAMMKALVEYFDLPGVTAVRDWILY